MPSSSRKKKLLIFLSHANEDKPIVRKLCKQLSDDGFDPWLDEERLLPGQDWSFEIEKKLRQSDLILICFSKKSSSKEGYIQREYKRAMSYQLEKPEGTIFVIPVRLDNCEIPFSLQELQCVDFPFGYERLLKSLNIRAGITSVKKKAPKIDDPIQEHKKVQLVLDGNFEDFNETKREDLVSVLASMLKTDSKNIRILQVYSGSIVVVIEIPRIESERLTKFARNKDFRLKAIGIRSVQIEDEQPVLLSPSTRPRQSDNRLRVIVADNDPRSRVAWQYLLSEWDYEPVLAFGTGDRLMTDVKAKARDKRCTLALIDMRLYDDDDSDDDSGLRLVNELGERVQCVIISEYGDQQILLKMIQFHQNLDFILKTSPPDSIKEVIDKVANKISASKRGLKFENFDVLEEISQTALKFLIKDYPDQVADILARLFPKATRLRLEKLNAPPPTFNISEAPRPTSIIFKVYEEEYYEPYVVKIARAEKIQQEVDRYNQFIYRKVTERATSRLVQSEILWDIGGVAYSYPGGFDLKTFSRFYEEKPITNIEDILKAFFNDIWSRHYLRAHYKSNVSLYKLYVEAWGDWFEKFINTFPEIGDLNAGFAAKELSAPNPITWLRTKVLDVPNDVSIMNSTRIALTHGDLHGDNLLVDNNNDVWVIDFERCGEGHILRDFIELETDIITRLGIQDQNPFEYIGMFLFILEHKEIQRFEDIELFALSANERIKKTLQTISIIRYLAFQNTEIGNAYEYLIGLLFNMIFRVMLTYNKHPQRGQNLALILASLICHRLDHWDEPWPPVEWKTYLPK